MVRNLFVTFCCLAIFLSGSLSLVAADVYGAFTPIEDTYINRNLPTSNFNEQLLLVTQDLPIGSSIEQSNRLIYIKFDLTGQTEEVTTAAFTLAPVTGTCVGAWDSTITLDIFGVSVDGWAEDTLTWDSADAVNMMDVANLTSLGTATLDATSGLWTLNHPDLATWIEAERVADSTATLMIQMSTGFASETAFFEDSESTGSAAGCTVPASGQPLLDLGSAPLAVSLTNAESRSINFSWIGWLLLMMGLVFLVGGTAVIQQRKPKRVRIKRRED